jgi:hypothetical protein
MELDIRIDSESMSINIENPYRFDVAQEMQGISDFGSKFGVDIASLQIEKLIPRMLKGVAGCEAGCPSDAKSLVRHGFGKFKLSYVEGGILTAIHKLGNGKSIEVKVFPDFD